MWTSVKYFLLFVLFLILSSCELMEPEVPGAEVIREDGKIFIRDQTDKRWDVTHAVEEYGFDPAAFQHGLGPTAIKPIQNPQMLRPGDAGYPGDYNETVVLGAELQGDARAYPLNVMIRHEIANEQFGNSHVAVAY